MLLVLAFACVLLTGCAGLTELLDEWRDDSVQCADEAKQAYRACMAEESE